MNNVIRAVAVGVCVVVAAGSASSQQQQQPQPERQCTAIMADYDRGHFEVTEQQAIDGIVVVVEPAGVLGWRIAVKNAGTDSALLVWDESTFVTSAGAASGRLIRGETRQLDTAKAQPPSPIPAGTMIAALAFAEQLVDYEKAGELEEQIARHPCRYSDAAIAATNNGRRARLKMQLGARLFLVVQRGEKKETWVGVVGERPRGKPAQSTDAEQP